MTSKWSAATVPSSRMSSSRRSPAAPIMPMREALPSVGLSRPSGRSSDSTKSPEHPHARGVVAVVDDDVDVVDVEQVHPAGGQVVGGGERAQPLADVVQRRAGGERGTGGGQGVGDVHLRRAAERGGQQVGPGQLHAATPVPDGDHVALVGGLEDDRASTAAALLVDEVAHLAARRLQREPHHAAGAAPAHGADEVVVGVEHGEAVARHRLDDDGLDLRRAARGC